MDMKDTKPIMHFPEGFYFCDYQCMLHCRTNVSFRAGQGENTILFTLEKDKFFEFLDDTEGKVPIISTPNLNPMPIFTFIVAHALEYPNREHHNFYEKRAMANRRVLRKLLKFHRLGDYVNAFQQSGIGKRKSAMKLPTRKVSDQLPTLY